MEGTPGRYPWKVPLEGTPGRYPWKVPLEAGGLGARTLQQAGWGRARETGGLSDCAAAYEPVDLPSHPPQPAASGMYNHDEI
jgi:hypothetical protein